MTRNYRPHENANKAKAKRAFALERIELREGPTEPRTPSAGVTSRALKTNPDSELIEAFLARRGKSVPP